jgi:hypothetical protein
MLVQLIGTRAKPLLTRVAPKREGKGVNLGVSRGAV